MNKEFNVNLPDQPYSTEYTLGKTVTCVYEGARYLEIVVDKLSKKFKHFGSMSDDKDQIVLSVLSDTEVAYVIDAAAYTIEVSLLLNQYRHADIDDYVEVLQTGEEYREVYPKTTGILDFIYDRDLTYDGKKFSKLTHRKPPVTDESMRLTVAAQLSYFNALKDEAIEIGDSDARKQQIDKMIKWLETYEEVYAGIPAYKVPYPVFTES